MNLRFERICLKALFEAERPKNFDRFMADGLSLAQAIASKIDSRDEAGFRRHWYRAEHVVFALWRANKSGLWKRELERENRSVKRKSKRPATPTRKAIHAKQS